MSGHIYEVWLTKDGPRLVFDNSEVILASNCGKARFLVASADWSESHGYQCDAERFVDFCRTVVENEDGPDWSRSDGWMDGVG